MQTTYQQYFILLHKLQRSIDTVLCDIWIEYDRMRIVSYIYEKEGKKSHLNLRNLCEVFKGKNIF